MNFNGTTVFITGASRGIGRRLAIRFAGRKASVALAARSRDGLEGTAERIDDEDRTLVVLTDVSDEDAVERAVAETVETFGGLDCVINNAGIAGPTAPVEDVDAEDWHDTLQTNVTGAFYVVKHAVEHLRESPRGRIINIASVGGKHPYPNRTPYATSKMAMIGLARTLAFELGEDGITANTICPGPVEGDRIEAVIRRQAEQSDMSYEEVKQELYTGDLPLGEMVDANDVAEMVLFLAGDEADHVTGQDLNVDSGLAWY